MLQLCEKTGEKTGIKKKVHPHLFRHSRLTELAKHLTEQELKVFSGWSMGSKMASIYVHLSGKDIDNKLLQINGLKVEQEKQEQKINKCPRCDYINLPNSKYCSNCGMVLEIKESFNLDKDFFQFLMEMYKLWKNVEKQTKTMKPISKKCFRTLFRVKTRTETKHSKKRSEKARYII